MISHTLNCLPSRPHLFNFQITRHTPARFGVRKPIHLDVVLGYLTMPENPLRMEIFRPPLDSPLRNIGK